MVVDEVGRVLVTRRGGAVPAQDDFRAVGCVPAGLEYCVRQYDASGAVIMHADAGLADLKHRGKIDGSGWVVADGNEFVDEKRFAVYLTEGCVGVRFGFGGTEW